MFRSNGTSKKQLLPNLEEMLKSAKAGLPELASVGWQDCIQGKMGKERVSGNRVLNAKAQMIPHGMFRIYCLYRIYKKNVYELNICGICRQQGYTQSLQTKLSP